MKIKINGTLHFQVKYQKNLKDPVEIIHLRFSDTLSSISDILKDQHLYSNVTPLILHRIIIHDITYII